MVKRYGTGELYGYDFSTLTPERIRDLSQASRKDVPCPFRPTESGKLQPKCNKKGGVCSLRQFGLTDADEAKATEDPVTTCPNRFLEGNLVMKWVGETLLGTENPDVISELPSLMGEAGQEGAVVPLHHFWRSQIGCR